MPAEPLPTPASRSNLLTQPPATASQTSRGVSPRLVVPPLYGDRARDAVFHPEQPCHHLPEAPVYGLETELPPPELRPGRRKMRAEVFYERSALAARVARETALAPKTPPAELDPPITCRLGSTTPRAAPRSALLRPLDPARARVKSSRELQIELLRETRAASAMFPPAAPTPNTPRAGEPS